jgi:5-methylthioadenosine/S-adenosylhomocysteine deaminase
VQHHKLPGRAHVDATAQAAARLGCRMVLARGWVDLGPAGEPLDSILVELDWLHAAWHGAANDRIRVASGPLAAWRCSDEAMRQTTALARSWHAPVHIHIAESADEVKLQLERCGKRPIEWLADLGVLGPDVHLVHAVHVCDHELDLIAQSGAMIVHCPTSNMYLASGAAPVRKMLDRGITVALGTDGSGSNNSQDMLECAKVTALLAKHATGDAQVLPPEVVVRMLALGGARLWQTQHDSAMTNTDTGYGRLVAGAPADITVVDLNSLRCQPVHNLASSLVYNASGADVHSVIVAGQVLVEGKRFVGLDETELLEGGRRASERLMCRVGAPRSFSAPIPS